MRIAFYEDQAARFGPIALTRPVFELICGRYSLRERCLRHLSISEWGGFFRPVLIESFRQLHPEAYCNDFVWLTQNTTLLINGSWLPDSQALKQLNQVSENEVGLIDDNIVYLKLAPLEAPLLTHETWDEILPKIAQTRRPIQASGHLIRYPWELVNYNQCQLKEDFEIRSSETGGGKLDSYVAVLGEREKIKIDPTAAIEPFVVIDTRQGPVSIGQRAVVHSFTRLEGPCHVGRESKLFGANIRGGTTIGPVCRVGGEVEASILHGFVNKYHTGFLGHSYVCPWVNLGALSTNSDLKNDYSNVRIPLNGEVIESGSVKVGCFIGDYTKTALGSLFNTGSSVGVMCMVLPGGELLPKHIPSFTTIWHGNLTERFDWQQSVQSAKVSMERRNREFTPTMERLFQTLYQQTAAEREKALHGFQEKLRRRQEPTLSPE